jgi:nitrogen regulatory protein PII
MLLVLIYSEGNDKKINSILNKFGVKVKTVTNASGTASASVLDYFGLAETRKDVYLAIIPDYLEHNILSKLKNAFKFEEIGTGITFTIPISSSNKFLVDSFKKSDVEEKVKDMKEDNNKYHLIITIVLEGYLEQAMAAAKKAGATGGTVIKGRGLANLVPAKVLGFNIEPEREVILNVVEDESKQKVMEEITSAVGIKTGGKGVCIALPISDAIGLNKYNVNKV